MLNYIKSELFRLRKNKVLWTLIISLVLFVVLEPFTFGEKSLEHMSDVMIFPYYLSIVLVLIVCGNEYKNKSLKNALSCGISKNKVYFGKIIVASIIGIALMVTTVGAAILSNLLVLGSEEMKYVPRLVLSAGVMIFPCIAAVILAITIKYLVKSNLVTFFIWGILSCEFYEILNWILPDSRKVHDVLEYLCLSDALHSGYSIYDGVIPLWYVGEGIIKILVASIISIGLSIFIKLKVNRDM